MHIHLVDFAVVSRSSVIIDPLATRFGDRSICPIDVLDEDLTGTCTRRKNSAQASGGIGTGLNVVNPTAGDPVAARDDRYEESTMDLINAPALQITRVIATFDKVGVYLWHCHLLSHEDNEMMRQFVVFDPNDPSTVFTGDD